MGFRPASSRARGTRARRRSASGGDREAADAIKGLRKPTVAAWALNQLARRRAKDVERLVEAGEELRAAQEELLAGGDRAAFQEAASKERELVADLSAGATAMASEEGERGSGLQEKIAGTLHAAALDEETAEELRAGRLVREREAIGGFGAPGEGPPPSTKPAKPTKSRPAKRARSKAAARTGSRGSPAGHGGQDRRASCQARARSGHAGARACPGARRGGRGARGGGGGARPDDEGAPEGGEARRGGGEEGARPS